MFNVQNLIIQFILLCGFSFQIFASVQHLEEIKGETQIEFIDRLARERAANPAQAWMNWSEIGQFEKPLENRLIDLTPGTALLVQSYMDLFFSFGAPTPQPLPETVNFDGALKADMIEAIITLPTSVKDLLKPYLGAIIAVRNMRVNGLAALLLGDDHKAQLGGISFLNIDNLDAKVNDWWAEKESSPYRNNSSENSLKMHAELDPDSAVNNRVKTLQFVILHELGHILAYGKNMFPRWDIILRVPYKVGDYPYLDFSWELNRGREILNSLEGESFKDYTGRLVYFKDESKVKLDNSEMPGLYAALKNTSLITPYATLHPHEDFAEFFTFYIFTELMGLKPSISILDKQGLVLEKYSIYKEIYSSRYLKKRDFVDMLLK